MATFGPQAASGATDDAGIGTIAWSNPGNVVSSNDTRATSASPDEDPITTHYLKVTFDTAALPEFASIDGIQVAVEGSRTGSSAVENTVKLTKNGTISGDNKSTGAGLPLNTDAVVTYGATNDTWGVTYANGDTIGCVIAYNVGGNSSARVDFVSLTVTYTAAAAAATVSKSVTFFSIL